MGQILYFLEGAGHIIYMPCNKVAKSVNKKYLTWISLNFWCSICHCEYFRITCTCTKFCYYDINNCTCKAFLLMNTHAFCIWWICEHKLSILLYLFGFYFCVSFSSRTVIIFSFCTCFNPHYDLSQIVHVNAWPYNFMYVSILM